MKVKIELWENDEMNKSIEQEMTLQEFDFFTQKATTKGILYDNYFWHSINDVDIPSGFEIIDHYDDIDGKEVEVSELFFVIPLEKHKE